MFLKLVFKYQLTKFVIVGLCCAAVEFGVFSFLVHIQAIDYLIANVIAVVIAIILNYVLSRKYVFQKSKYSRSMEVISFVVFSLMAIALNQLILWLFVEQALITNIQLGKAMTIIIVAIFNFSTKKYLVFKQ
ncbi:GtrA family protein [Parapedobacter koreensis]|uniref:Putative flippase GtrA (Transmembrane translocase of bactoprenol-linked glucose) n=1 Tax=Parapedobacter koreensis TaxID=332977 RepID=A0A1H7IJX6_9SPHI|nr:GtrA family protein [Parapedobacter koreensis]SEK62027.1 Putative flippase GtrA (transmembrane translocase of bactoprenol-linked glucose) [Parapedobacter koreensis]